MHMQVDIPALMRALESWPYDDAPPDEDAMRERPADDGFVLTVHM